MSQRMPGTPPQTQDLLDLKPKPMRGRLAALGDPTAHGRPSSRTPAAAPRAAEASMAVPRAASTLISSVRPAPLLSRQSSCDSSLVSPARWGLGPGATPVSPLPVSPLPLGAPFHTPRPGCLGFSSAVGILLFPPGAAWRQNVPVAGEGEGPPPFGDLRCPRGGGLGGRGAEVAAALRGWVEKAHRGSGRTGTQIRAQGRTGAAEGGLRGPAPPFAA